MTLTNINISESERLKLQYEEILQKVKERFRVKDAEWINISQAKASRVLNNKQFDMITLCEMASFVGYNTNLQIIERK